jgi:hypothetical protein
MVELSTRGGDIRTVFGSVYILSCIVLVLSPQYVQANAGIVVFHDLRISPTTSLSS